MLLCVAAVQKINEVFSTVNDEFEEFSYGMKVYRHVTHFLRICTHILYLNNLSDFLILCHLAVCVLTLCCTEFLHKLILSKIYHTCFSCELLSFSDVL